MFFWAWMRGEFGGEWIQVYVWLGPFMFTWNYHKIANQLYSNIKQVLKNALGFYARCSKNNNNNNNSVCVCPMNLYFNSCYQLSYFKSWKMMQWKCCTQYASKFGKLSSGHRTGKGQFSFQSQRKAIPKNAQITAQLHSSHMLVK